MTISRLASLRPDGAPGLALMAAVALAACSGAEPVPTVSGEPSGPAASPTATPTATPSPSPTPEPTPRFTNEPDDELAALIPTQAAGFEVVVAPFDEFALTPGDIGLAYGDVGARFASLALAYVSQPRTTLYAMRVDGARVETEDLEPFLATAGRYVGIAGLDRAPWRASDVGGNLVWVRPEDNATAAGTTIYTWSSGEYVFLLIGVDDTINRAIIEQLPGEPAPTTTPVASPAASPRSSGAPSARPSASP